MVKQIHCHRSDSLHWRTYLSTDHRLIISVGYHKHLRHKLLQNDRSECNIGIERNSFSNYDVLHGFTNETGDLPCWDYSSDVHAAYLPDFAFIVSVRIIVHDIDVGICVFLRNFIWIVGWIVFYGSNYWSE